MMMWRDRDMEHEQPEDPFGGRGGRPGGDWRGIRPSFDNPLSWSIPLLRVSGIAVRIHVFFLLYIVVKLGRGLVVERGETLGVGMIAVLMGVLFLIVLVHEFGHCIACRWMGGSADEILLWPLGGLAYCQPPHDWKSHFITAAGGPAVNVVLCLVAGLMLGILTGDWLGTALPNPLVFGGGVGIDVFTSWPLLVLYALNYISLILLLFNLLPIFPLDGGRLVQAVLWKGMGYSRSMRLAVYTGYVGAILLGMFGAITGHWILVGIAIFGGVTCWMTLKQVQFTDEFLGFESDYSQSLDADEAPAPREPTRRERRQAAQEAKRLAREAEEAAQVERILQKISERGMDGLTSAERATLRTATERKKTGS